jgi:hypothetical protein
MARLLEKQYARLLDGAQLGDLPDTPTLHILATSMTTGGLVDFGRSGVSFSLADGNVSTYPVSSLPLARAVAASAAFPPLVRPVPIDRADLHAKEVEFPYSQFLTDGGVYDNLGTHRMLQVLSDCPSETVLMVSDASSGFDLRISKRKWGIFARNVRASDILMGRVAELEAHAIESQEHPIVRVSIHDVVRQAGMDVGDYEVQDVDIQRACRFLRTDLDRFTLEEIVALTRHGYEAALAGVIGILTTEPDSELIRDPCPAGWPYYLEFIQQVRLLGSVVENLVRTEQILDVEIPAAGRRIFGTPMTEEQRAAVDEEQKARGGAAIERRAIVERLEAGSHRHIRIWDSSDPASWMLAVVFLVVVAIAAFTIVLT